MLIRLVPPFVADDWKASFGAETIYNPGEEPAWALSTFLPGERDSGLISLYEIGGGLTAPDVAAAIMFQKSKNTHCVFAGAERAAIEAKGLVIEKTDGATCHPEVNACHFEIKIANLAALTAIANVFLQGDVRFVDIKELDPKLNEHARANRIHWIDTANSSGSDGWNKVRNFVKNAAVMIAGQPAT